MTSAIVLPSGIELWLGDSVQRDQVGEPFDPWLNLCSGRLCSDDRLMPIILHLVLGIACEIEDEDSEPVYRR